MGYNKIIKYGNYIELYEYEKDVVGIGGIKRKRSSDIGDEDLGVIGQDTLSERDSSEAMGKRQDNARRASMSFRRIVAANLGGLILPILVTLTYAENFTDLSGAYKHLSSFIQSLRYSYGKIFKYVCVCEFQERGAVHFHALFWGLPEELFLLERKNRTIARLWGHGYVYLKMTDGDNKLSFYLTKYMAKAFIDPRLKNQKCYVASRNILRPIVIGGCSPAWVILDDYGVKSEAIEDREFPTKWLGKGRFRLFKINND